MNRISLAACGLAAATGLTLSAQQPASRSPQRSQEPPVMTVTLVGCLKPWPGAASSGLATATTPPTTTTTPPIAQYVLTDVPAPAADARKETPMPDSAGHSDAGLARSQYLLRSDSPSVQLREHVNQQVEVTGMRVPSTPPQSGMEPSPQPMGASGAGSPGTGAPAPGMERPAASLGEPPAVVVTAITMIAATCSPARER